MAAAAERKAFALAGRRVWVAGHRGMVGSAIVRRLERTGAELIAAGRETVDLVRQKETADWLASTRPDALFLAAARVGGIHANNTRPAEFLYENLAIQTNVIHAAWQAGVKKLLFLGSSCIYPRLAPQPIVEDALLTGPLEPTNEWYAIAKIAGLKLAQAYRRQYGADFIAAMPCNLYGPGDNYDLEQSHVVGALMVKLHRAKLARAPSVELWGTGTPRREFLYVDDLADACVFVLRAQALRQPRAVEYRGGRGHHRRRTRRGNLRDCGVPRADRVRPRQAGRGAAQDVRHLAACCTRLEGEDAVARRPRSCLS